MLPGGAVQGRCRALVKGMAEQPSPAGSAGAGAARAGMGRHLWAEQPCWQRGRPAASSVSPVSVQDFLEWKVCPCAVQVLCACAANPGVPDQQHVPCALLGCPCWALGPCSLRNHWFGFLHAHQSGNSYVWVARNPRTMSRVFAFSPGKIFGEKKEDKPMAMPL